MTIVLLQLYAMAFGSRIICIDTYAFIKWPNTLVRMGPRNIQYWPMKKQRLLITEALTYCNSI